MFIFSSDLYEDADNIVKQIEFCVNNSIVFLNDEEKFFWKIILIESFRLRYQSVESQATVSFLKIFF